jgi:hypothetical protein
VTGILGKKNSGTFIKKLQETHTLYHRVIEKRNKNQNKGKKTR